MHSMTGYGRCRMEAEGREMTVELKTVNHRFLDLNIRLPRGLLFLEDTLRKALTARLGRGHVDVFMTYRNLRDDAREVQVDTALLNAYVAALDHVSTLTSFHDDRTITRLAEMPDVLTVAEQAEDQEAVCALGAQALGGALDALTAMRAREGEALQSALTDRLNRFEALIAGIGERAPSVVEEYRTRLDARIAELLDAPPDPQRLAQEVAVMADRAAIDEELVRLDCHIGQMRQIFGGTEAAGRKLDFLVQELNREVNTIGSKAQDVQIAALVVEAKAEIEKIREQVQNIE